MTNISDGGGDNLTENCFVDNVTERCTCLEYATPGDFTTAMMGVVSLPVVIGGVFANVLSLMVFSHPMMRHLPFNWYLTAMTASDMVILVSAFLVLVLQMIGEYFEVYAAVAIRYLS